MKKFVAVFVLVSVAVGFFVLNVSAGVFDDLLAWTKQAPHLLAPRGNGFFPSDLVLEEPEREVSTPSPLRIFQPASPPSASLSAQGVFQWTNVHRQQAGLQVLLRNALLDEIAQSKVEDMFARQYFEHVSPLGEGISHVAEEFGYEFLAIGENLALGNYASDQALVQAWMDSPGHRANILGISYSEIGIAVQRGQFQGNTTWLAVQVFGRPLSECDFPDEALKALIAWEKVQLEELALELERLRGDMEAHRPKFGPAYNRKVTEYNALVDQYNALAAQVQADIATYNLQAQAFNACIKTPS